MNLSPAWVEVLARHGIESTHWTSVGRPTDDDRTILQFAHERGWVVFTHDLDFGALLAASGADGPSVLQVRTQDVTPAALAALVLAALTTFADALASGALVSVDESRLRARILPIRRPADRKPPGSKP